MTENTRRTFLAASVAAGGTALTGVPSVAAAEARDGGGRPPLAQPPDRELRAILREVDPGRIEANVRKLVSFGTRHTLSTQDDPNQGIGAARDWIFAELRKYAARSDGR